MVMHRRRTMASEADEWYVTRLLSHQYDGILNTRNGHSSSLTYWEDLIDDTGNFDFPITSAQTVNSNNIHLTNGLQATSSFISPSLPNTIEFVFKKASTPSGYQAMHPWLGWYCTIDKNKFRFKNSLNKGIDITDLSNTIACISYRRDVTIEEHLPMINGVLRDDFVVSAENWGSSGANRLFCQKGVTSYPFVGEIYAIRIYHSYLTDEERLHNYNVDKKRFGIVT